MADGVGGWRNYGIDPSTFPRKLMQACERLVTEGRYQPQSPANIIAASYHEILEQKEPLIGELSQHMSYDFSDTDTMILISIYFCCKDL